MTIYGLIYIITSVIPASNSIIDALSASDVSVMLCALRITLSDKTTKTYLSPIRDIPEHEEWIRGAILRRRRIMLVGKDASSLRDKIVNPLKFWSENTNKHVIHIWLIVLNLDEDTLPVIYADENGARIDIPYACVDGAVYSIMHHEPIATDFETPAGGVNRHAETDWYTSRAANENNIKIYFFISRRHAIPDISAYLSIV